MKESGKTILIKPQIPRVVRIIKHFYEYHTGKLKYRDLTYLILKFLPWWIFYYCFWGHIQLLIELESVIVVTAPYF